MFFLTPYAALLAALVLVPLAAFTLAERRRRRVARLLALREPALAARVSLAVAVTAVAALLGLAAAQPTLVRHTETQVRTDAEAWFVIDTSLSMEASAGPGGTSRFTRAQRLAMRLRDRLKDVPVGLASITDRAMPHLFPSADRDTFERTLTKAIGIERPPPTDGFSVRITTLGSLARLASDNYFSDAARHRLLVVLTDGETKPFLDQSLARLFQQPPGVATIFVRIWNGDERVYVDGRPDPLYQPDPSGAAYVQELAAATGGTALRSGDFGRIVRTAREDLGEGPTRALTREERRVAFAPWVAVLAFLPLGFLLYKRNV